MTSASRAPATRSAPSPESELLTVRRVAVGSLNPVKVAAVTAVFARVAPEATITGVAAASGVPDQPWGDAQTIAGARARARQLLADPTVDLAVGLEGGVVEDDAGGLRTCAWAVVCHRDGREGVGGSLVVPLPPRVAARLRAGEELGPAMDAEARATNTKHGLGAVGILTAGLIDRQAAYEPLVVYALAPFLARSFFEPSEAQGERRS